MSPGSKRFKVASVAQTSTPNESFGISALTLNLIIILALCVTYGSAQLSTDQTAFSFSNDIFVSDVCPQVSELTPTKHRELWDQLNNKIGTSGFKMATVDWLSGAVQVETEIYDDMGPVGEDERWEKFTKFHEYLHTTFPLIHSTLDLTNVNTYGLLYEWKGSNMSLKPLLFMAHQDVVPVNPATVNEWTHGPYSGEFDGTRVWGRGAIDNKSGLIGVMSTIEMLIDADFEPTRTVILAFGFDEEIGGEFGAGTLSHHLLEKYGRNGVAMVLDEGLGFATQFGSTIAVPGVAEKGFLNVKVEVTAPGGHSSRPPPHTSIGMLAAMLVEYENNPHDINLTRDRPLYSAFLCIAEHARDVPSYLRDLIRESATSDEALLLLKSFVAQDPLFSLLVSTSQAITVVEGGIKSNALPEQAWAILNYRIDILSSLAEIRKRDTDLLRDLALSFNLTYTAFGVPISGPADSSVRTLSLTNVFGDGSEPTPISPVGVHDAPYQLLSGTIKAAHNAHRSDRSIDPVLVAPITPPFNTDTRFYVNVSEHIFRYGHVNLDTGPEGGCIDGVHTINECHEIDSFLEQIRFYTGLILNADEATNL